MKTITKDIATKDIERASNCTVKKYYGLITKTKIPYFLVKSNRKWHWISAGGDKNYSENHKEFDVAMQTALEFDDNQILLFDNKNDLFRFMINPSSYLSGDDLPFPA